MHILDLEPSNDGSSWENMKKQFGTTLFFSKNISILRNFIANNPYSEASGLIYAES